MKPHKWAKEIKAWADGREIQIRHPRMTKDSKAFDWIDLEENSIFRFDNKDYEFRIKPQPKEPQYLYAYFNKTNSKIELDCVECDLGFLKYLGKIPLLTEVDDDN